MRMRPAAKLVLILIVFAVLIGAIYFVKSSGMIKPAPLPELPQVSKDVAVSEPRVEPQKQVDTPPAPIPEPVATPSSQDQNSGLNKLLQAGKR